MGSPFIDFFRKRTYIPFVFFGIILVLLYFSSGMVEKTPKILTIEPSIAFPGEVVTITGEDFHASRNGGTVTLAGSRIISTSYLEWNNEQIRFQIPLDAGSGMVLVTTARGKSNGVLFTNKKHIPVILSGPSAPGLPHIESIEPDSGPVGTLVTVKGLNFGFDRGEGQVLFNLQAPGDQLVQKTSGTIPCSEIDYDYETWTDHEIQFYVPDGASSGGIKIVIDRGESNAKYFEVKDLPGSRLYSNRKGYQLSYEIGIFGPRGRPDGSLDVWVPGIVSGLEQRSVEWERDPSPLWEDYFGIMRYHFGEIAALGDQRISLTYWFERYSVENQIEIQNISTDYNRSHRLYDVYTGSNAFIPADQDMKTLAEQITRRVRNPYSKAETIYNYLIDNLKFSASPGNMAPYKALEAGQADSYIYSILFCSLSRGIGIPSRPVAGYLVYGDKVMVRHFWAEFYIEGFGWVPVDPSLGDGAHFGDFPPAMDDLTKYYFGNLNNQHLSFTRGVVPLKSFLPGEKQYQKKGCTLFRTSMKNQAV